MTGVIAGYVVPGMPHPLLAPFPRLFESPFEFVPEETPEPRVVEEGTRKAPWAFSHLSRRGDIDHRGPRAFGDGNKCLVGRHTVGWDRRGRLGRCGGW